MNTTINQLVRSVIHKNSLHECSVNELEKLVAQYPYFGPAQFLLAQKLKEEKSPVYEKQSQRAILYFQDHLWFDYMTRGEEGNGVVIEGNSIETYTKQSPVAVTDSPVEVNPDSDQEIEELPLTDNTPEPIITDEMMPDNPEEEKEIQANEDTELVAAVETDVEVIEEPETDTLIDNTDTSSIEEDIEPIPVEETEMAATPEPVTTSFIDEEENEITEEPAAEEKTPVLPQFKIEPVSAQAATLIFEPYHTVDYFASQGIRFKEEEKPKDRFGQQLKSFTEWLKAMKKLPETENPAQPAAVTEDRKVTQMAEYSLAEREVVTEAMADVWEQQGNSQKAIDTYRKLSLLNPAKSAYFAAKIEHLKNL